jgi:hypothetical protein
VSFSNNNRNRFNAATTKPSVAGGAGGGTKRAEWLGRMSGTAKAASRFRQTPMRQVIRLDFWSSDVARVRERYFLVKSGGSGREGQRSEAIRRALIDKPVALQCHTKPISSSTTKFV